MGRVTVRPTSPSITLIFNKAEGLDELQRPVSLGPRPEGLIEILNDVVDMLDPDGQADHIGRNSRQAELFCIQLPMGRRGRVADE